MNQTPEKAMWLADKIQRKLKPYTHVTTVVCPPFIDLTDVKSVLQKDVLRLGAQDIHERDEGPYTGETSGQMLNGIVEYVIVGHSERRRYEHETDRRIALKLAAAIRNDLKPILCIGERLDDRENGHAKRVIVDQLHGCLSQLTDEDLNSLTIAYEPVWAISHGDGHGHVATPKEVRPMVAAIRETLEELFGESASSRVEILYGGSVNRDDAKAFLELENVNGLLVGGASLIYEEFAAIVATAASLSDDK